MKPCGFLLIPVMFWNVLWTCAFTKLRLYSSFATDSSLATSLPCPTLSRAQLQKERLKKTLLRNNCKRVATMVHNRSREAREKEEDAPVRTASRCINVKKHTAACKQEWKNSFSASSDYCLFQRKGKKILVRTWAWRVRIGVSLKVTLYTLRFANQPLLLWNVAFVTITPPPTPLFFIQESCSWSFDGEAALGMRTVTCRKWCRRGFSAADLAEWIYPER